MEKNEDNVRLFDNVLNNNVFKFLVREYYSQSMNPFQVLRTLNKILSSKISKLLKIKYILLFLTVLKKLTINESIFNQNINPIINENIGDILTRKADYVIIIQYVIFLVQIGEVDFALSRLQIFSTDPRFMNNGELIFYRAIITYSAESNSNTNNSNNNNSSNDNKNFIYLIEKSLSLIKKDTFLYCEWVLKYLINKNLINELTIILKHDKIREYIKSNNLRFTNFLNAFNDVDYIEISKKISNISDELENNFLDFSIVLKFVELVENYYSEYYPNIKNNFLLKLINLNKKYFFDYIRFLYAHLLIDCFNTKLYILIENILQEIKMCIDNKIEFFDGDNMNLLKEIMLDNMKYMIEILLKEKIYKKMLVISKKTVSVSVSVPVKEGYSNPCIWKAIQYSKKLIKRENLEESLKNILRLINLIDYNYLIIFGDRLLDKYDLKTDVNKIINIDENFKNKILNFIKIVKI